MMSVFAVTTTVIYVPTQHRLTALAPDAPNEVLALNSSATYVGITLAGAVGGLLLATTTPAAIPAVGACCAVLAGAVYMCSHLRQPRTAPQETRETTQS
jgi:predicted MFS family arabinose efflux permease